MTEAELLDEVLTKLAMLSGAMSAEAKSIFTAPQNLASDKDKLLFYQQHAELISILSEHLQQITEDLDKKLLSLS